MRKLIDADKLKKDLKSVTLSNGTLLNTNTVLALLDKYPTAYDVDKVVERLQDESCKYMDIWSKTRGKADFAKMEAFDEAVEIVNQADVCQ